MIVKLESGYILWSIRLNLSSGRFCRVPNKLFPGKTIGKAHKCKGNWFAIYVLNGELFFRINKDEYMFRDIISMSNEIVPPKSRAFKVKFSNNKEFMMTYRSKFFTWHNRIDPTYDALDESIDDMLIDLPDLFESTSRQTYFKKKWS